MFAQQGTRERLAGTMVGTEQREGVSILHTLQSVVLRAAVLLIETDHHECIFIESRLLAVNGRRKAVVDGKIQLYLDELELIAMMGDESRVDDVEVSRRFFPQALQLPQPLPLADDMIVTLSPQFLIPFGKGDIVHVKLLSGEWSTCYVEDTPVPLRMSIKVAQICTLAFSSHIRYTQENMTQRTNRFEWISLLYLLFFVLAVLSPSLYSHGYFGLSQATLEEATIFVFGLAGLLTFMGYERLMDRRDKEHEKAEMDYHKAKSELIESYAYIGTMNRKIELLKKLANDTSLSLVDSKKLRKELFHAIAANACSAAGAHAGLIRFVELSRLRTDREFHHHPDSKFTFRVSNRDLRNLHEQKVSHAFVLSEDEKQILVVPSDRSQGDMKAYLLLHLDSETIPEIDPSLLKVFVNQAEMLYTNLAENVVRN